MLRTLYIPRWVRFLCVVALLLQIAVSSSQLYTLAVPPRPVEAAVDPWQRDHDQAQAERDAASLARYDVELTRCEQHLQAVMLEHPGHQK